VEELTSTTENVEKIIPSSKLYLILKDTVSGEPHLVTIRENLDRIPESTKKYGLLGLLKRLLKKKNYVLAKCEPACKEPNNLEFAGFVYVGSRGYIAVCGSPFSRYHNARLISPREYLAWEQQRLSD